MSLTIAYYGSINGNADGNWNNSANWFSYPGFASSKSHVNPVPLGRVPNASTDIVVTYAGNITTGPTGGYSGPILNRANSFSGGNNIIEAGSYSGFVQNSGEIAAGATFSGQVLCGNLDVLLSSTSGSSWTTTCVPAPAINGVCSSSSGQIVYVTSASGGMIYKSVDYGNTYAALYAAGGAFWGGICCSADGSKVYAAISSGSPPTGVLYSSNGGASWTQSTGYTGTALRICCDSTGQYVYVGTLSTGHIYASTNFGVSLSVLSNSPTGVVAGICCSSDGSIIYAAPGSNTIFKSTNFGSTWVAQGSSETWTGIKCSANGSVIYGASNSGLFMSNNGGTSYSNVYANVVESITCDSTGQYVYGQSSGLVINSSNSGATINTSFPVSNSMQFACSSDGSKVIGITADFTLSTATALISGATIGCPLLAQNGTIINTTVTGLITSIPLTSYLKIEGGTYAPTESIKITGSGNPYTITPQFPSDPGFVANFGTFSYGNLTLTLPTGFFIQ